MGTYITQSAGKLLNAVAAAAVGGVVGKQYKSFKPDIDANVFAAISVMVDGTVTFFKQ